MGAVPKLHEYLLALDFLNAKSSKEFIGTKVTNPAMYLEENIPVWSRTSSLGEISAALAVFKERVCISEFPARFSPPFWLAQAALQTVYKVLSSYLLANFSGEVLQEVNDLLFDLWRHLISAGPGSSHLEMMDIIFKNQQFLLWKYMETLTGEDLNLLITTLKCDFVYEEDVSSVHYATLMETHIDKIFRHILTPEQFQEAQRGFLDLHLYYLSRMNHVPPHIGPRLSHLCFLICQKYELENPYLGVDDWVLMRHHLKTIKDVVTDWSFTIASESQYRAPITLEKIFQAALIDNMLELLFKDFTTLLLAICNHNNSKKCKRLFLAYQTALFQQIDIDNMEVQPEWMFDQCITTLTQVASTNGIVTHMEQMIIAAEHNSLLKFTDLTRCKKEKWQKLLENYVVSGRSLLVKEATYLLESHILVEGDVFNWKENLTQAKLLIDIISDLPKSFLQDDEDSTVVNTVENYAAFLLSLITKLRSAELVSKVQENIHKCVIKCLAKDPLIKVRLAAMCVQEDIINFQDMNFVRELMFCVDKLLKDDDCLTVNETLSSTVESLISGALNTCREKGYIPVDFNSLMLSVCLTCISGDGYIQTDTTGPPYDIYLVLYNSVVLQFIRMHQTNGTLRLISNIVPQVIQLIHEGIEQGTSVARCVSFLQWLGTSCPEVVVGHCAEVVELFLDWECYYEIHPLIPVVYRADPLSVVSKVPVMFDKLFDKLKSAGQTDRQTIIAVLHLVVENHAEVFSPEHISQLVSMYKHETTRSQQMILQIIHQVALHYPAKVFGCYPHLTDDTKFPVTSLKNRAPILAALTQHSEDLAKKTTDYLMTHIANKDNAVSLVAMETLEPILKQSPMCLMKHKQKLKTVEKTSSCQRVKEICRNLVPDTQPKGPKNVTKGNKLTPKEPEVSKTSFQKRSLQLNKKSAIATSKGSTPTQTSSETVPMKQTEAEKVIQTDTFDSDSVKATNAGSSSNNLNVKESADTKDIMEQSRTYSVLTVKSLEKETVVSDSVDTTVHDQETEHASRNSAYVDTDLCHSDANVSSERTASQGVNAENLKHSDNENRMVQAKEVWTEKVHAESSGMLLSSDKSVNCKKNEESEEVIDTNSVDSNGLIDDLELEKPPVYLSFHQSCQSQVSMLRRHLKMAGYESWVDTGQTGSGDRELHAGIQEAKVVICCLNDKFLSSEECCKEVATALDSSKPVIPLAFQRISSPNTSSLKDHLAIRFYTKPGEVKVTMGFWVEHKFQALLMRLNYLRILPDEKIITKAYENWWLPKQQSDAELTSGKGVVRPVSAPYFPNVFISYDWGKQHQVKTLYEQLTSLDFSCWLGVYQMSGSESLYNKITQGLHGCRVVLACVTKKYTRAENCQQEVRLAHSLKRPIIPLLLEEVRWPLEDEIGKILKEYDSLKLEKGQGKKVFQNGQFENLIYKLNLYVPNAKLEVIKSTDQNGDGDKPGPKQETTLNQKAPDGSVNETKSVVLEQVQDNNKNLKMVNVSMHGEKHNRNAMQKSSSMFEIEKASRVMTVSSNRPLVSKTDDDLIVKKPVPEGVIVDEMGYTVKSSRSKSCVIL